MSYMIGKEAWNVALDEVVRNLEDAVKQYDDFLITYGTVPNMKKAQDFRLLIQRIKDEDFVEEK